MNSHRSLPPKTNLSATPYGPRKRELLIALVMLGLIIVAGVLIFLWRGSTAMIAMVLVLTTLLEVFLAYIAFHRRLAHWPIEKWLLQAFKWSKRGRKWVRGGAMARTTTAKSTSKTPAKKPSTAVSQGWGLQALLRLSPLMITVAILGTWTMVLLWIGEDGIREAEFTLLGFLGG